MRRTPIEILGTVLFGLAVVHTFLIKRFQHLACSCPEGSVGENLFHLLGEVEIVFGLWAGVMMAAVGLLKGGKEAVQFVESANFTEPAFVFAIMTVAATRPILESASGLIELSARALPVARGTAFYVAALIIGPLLGSFITEPAAMTVTALILRDRFFAGKTSQRFKYATLAVLFVNISIGGVLTSFAAPPVLMVADAWHWDFQFMLAHFGWKSAVAVILNASLAAALLRKELKSLSTADSAPRAAGRTPWRLRIAHLVFLALVVANSHHIAVFMWIFLFFLGFTTVTRKYQDELQLNASLLVGFFLAGLVVLGGSQRWWLEWLIRDLRTVPLFLGTTALTAVTDNAALTFLGSQIPSLSDAFKHALVAGAVAGGGLTVIANAPNPAGFSILGDSFGAEGISPNKLLVNALVPTAIAMLCLWFLPAL